LRKGVSLDGGMVNIRGEGWKEFKTGLISTLLPPAQQTETQADAVCQDSHYTAVLGSVEQFAPALWALAVEQHVPYAGHVAVTADGAPWIWNLTADLFPCSTQLWIGIMPPSTWPRQPKHAIQPMLKLLRPGCPNSNPIS